MVYVTSDLHGFPLDKFKHFLGKIGFCKDDYLYILGDVIDRGSDGVQLLQWIMGEPNVELILGNHEAMMLACRFMFEDKTDALKSSLTEAECEFLRFNWIENDGDVTRNALNELKAEEGGEEKIRDIFDFLWDAPWYDVVSVNGKDYILTHGGLGNFRKDKKMSEYTLDELTWERPDINDRYFNDMTVVFGHTPTIYYRREYLGKVLKTDTWIDVDVGVGIGQDPVLFRLDDEKCLYYKYEVK